MFLLIKVIIVGLSYFGTVLNVESHRITVTVKNINSNEGELYVAIYDSETSFLEKPYKGITSKIENNACTVIFNSIIEGDYAVSVYHDRNENGKLDVNFLGIPKEDYNCSNNAKGHIFAPKWEDAMFKLRDDIIIGITL